MAVNVGSRAVSGSVLYAEHDYVGLIRRIIIVVVDGIVVATAWPLAGLLWYSTIDPQGDPYAEAVFSWTVFTFLYLIVLKPSRFRSAGLWVTRSRIVDHRGNQPSAPRMAFRLLLWLLGPVNPVIDLLWLTGERHRQTLRDKFAGTYVVRKDAVPITRSHRRGAWYNFLGARFFSGRSSSQHSGW